MIYWNPVYPRGVLHVFTYDLYHVPLLFLLCHTPNEEVAFIYFLFLGSDYKHFFIIIIVIIIIITAGSRHEASKLYCVLYPYILQELMVLLSRKYLNSI